MKSLILLAIFAGNLVANADAQTPPAFAVASIRPATESVRFESDGETKLLPGIVRMHDVTIETCIKWAYNVQRAQVSGPRLLTSERYDITAKADSPATSDEMKTMMRTLLADRFKLAFHQEKKELRSFGLIVIKPNPNLKPAGPDEEPYRQNSAMGTTARATTMQELADFLGGPVQKPVVDKTNLPGRWNFSFDFTKYLTDAPKGLDDYLIVLNETLQGELGLKLEPQKNVVNIMIIDHIEKPTEN